MRTVLMLLAVIILGTGVPAAATEVATPDLTDFDYFDTPTWELPDDAVEMRVDRVHDGDSIYLTEPDDDWWESYRVIGIQAPEVEGYREEECYGDESAEFVKALLPAGTRVWIQQDISDKDQNGRYLRHIFIEDPDSDGVYPLGEVLVRGGYARAKNYPPDDLYADVLEEAQEYAWDHPTNMWTCDEWQPLIEH